MIIETLSRLGAEADLLLLYNDKWLLTPNTFEGRLLIRAMDDYGAALKPVSVVRHGKVWTWQDSFTKLLAFEQGQYQRVLSLDSDATVLQTMDELFTTPMASVAAPNAYWLDQGALSSQVILIQPSKDEYQRIVRDESHLKDDDFDMEVLNHLYKGNATRLPHRPYNLITGEFRRPTHYGYLGSKDEVWNASAVLEEAKYVHFSDWPLPKPWMKGSDTQVKGLLANCTTNAELDCDSLTVWEGIYQDYWARRGVSNRSLYEKGKCADILYSESATIYSRERKFSHDEQIPRDDATKLSLSGYRANKTAIAADSDRPCTSP